jgi:membrane-bound serine protease (ClpP class)
LSQIVSQLILWLIIIAIVLAIFSVFVVIWVVRAHQKKVSAGREDLLGRTAVVDQELNPKGVVLIEGERWTATSDSGKVEPEEEVIITKVEGLRLRVSKKE